MRGQKYITVHIEKVVSLWNLVKIKNEFVNMKEMTVFFYSCLNCFYLPVSCKLIFKITTS